MNEKKIILSIEELTDLILDALGRFMDAECPYCQADFPNREDIEDWLPRQKVIFPFLM